MQDFQLLLDIPDLPRFDAVTAVAWHLFDRQSNLLREGTGPLAAGSVPWAGRTVIVLPARRVVYIETPLPPVSAAKRDALLRYAIEDKLTIDPATVHAVVLGKAMSKDANTHVVAAIDRAWFASVLHWLADAGIEPAQAVSTAALIPVSAGEWGVKLAGSHGVARRADGFAYSFDIERGNDSPSAMPPEPPFALTLAVKEARDEQVPPLQLTVFVDQAAAQAANAPWLDTWRRVLDCPVRVVVKPAPRMVATEAGNLLAGDFAPRATTNGWKQSLRPALILAVLFACLHITFVVIDAWLLDQKRRSLENEMTQVFRQAFPKAQAIVDPPLQMQRNLDTMKRERGHGTTDESRALFAQLSACIGAVQGLTPTSINFSAGTATAEMTVPDQARQQQLRARAAEIPGMTITVGASNIVRLSAKADR